MINSLTDLFVLIGGIAFGGLASVVYFSWTGSKLNWKK